MNETTLVKFDAPSVIEQVKNTVAPFAGLTIKDLEDKEGYEKVRVALGTCVSTRTGFVATCKEARDKANKYSDYVRDQEKIGVAEIKKIEDALRIEKERIDEEKEAIKQAKAREEAAKLQVRVDALAKFGYTHPDSFDLSVMDQEEFEKLLHKKEDEFQAAEKARIEKEEQERKDREELEKLRAEKAAFEEEKRKMEEQKAAAEREKQMEAARQEAAEKARKEEEERVKQESDAKFIEWLTKNGVTKATVADGFHVLEKQEDGTTKLYLLMSTYGNN